MYIYIYTHIYTHIRRCRQAPLEHRRELAFIINTLLRIDDATAAPYLAIIVRAINTLLVTRRLAIQLIKFPPNGVVFRGGGLPDEHRGFYESGREFRVAGFLASSFSQATAEHFMCSARARSEPCVMWVIHVDPAGEHSPAKRCMHVSYVERSNMPDEMEYLFAPYSPFTVKQVW
jgi:hypothetical protein